MTLRDRHASAGRARGPSRGLASLRVAVVDERAEDQGKDDCRNECIRDAATKQAATQRESCIGAVTIPCQDELGGAAAMGMVDCNTREWVVWNKRLNGAYRIRSW